MLEDQNYLALWFGWGNLFLISGGIEKKLWDFQNAQTLSLQNSCYIPGEVSCSTEQLHNLCIWFFPFPIRSNTIRESTEVKENSAKYLKILSMNKETNRGLKILLWGLLGINSILVYLNNL